MILNKVYKSEGGINVPPIQKVNLRKGYYAIRWDFKSKDESIVEYMEYIFDHKPSIEEIRSIINTYYNKIIDNKILSEFNWNNMLVWLSLENLFNYKAAFDLAKLTNGDSLPVTFKFGTIDNPVYYTFTTIELLLEFYTKVIKFILGTVSEGWKLKDSINYTTYLY